MATKQYTVTGYVGKSGKNKAYKVIGKWADPENGKKRVRLQSFGKEPIEFWADADKLCDPPAPVRRPDEATQQCWECGGSFTYRECMHNGGDWNDGYCGC